MSSAGAFPAGSAAAPSSIALSVAAADATVVLPFDFTRLIFAAALGYILFDEFPGLWTWAGGVLIFAAVLWMTRGEARRDTPQKTET